MLAIASQTAGPNWLMFLRKLIGTLEVTKAKKNVFKNRFKKKILDFLKFHGQRRTLYLVINNQLMKQLINQSFRNVLLSTFQSLDEQNKSRMSYVLTADN